MKNKHLKSFLKAVLIIAVSVLSIKLVLFFLPFKELEQFKNKPYSTVILDRNDNILQTLTTGDGTRREFVPFGKIPELVKDIFIKSEDRRFYIHPGFDPAALTRSLFLNARYKTTVSGASTITMQLARLVNPHPKGLSGKFFEIVDSMRIEGKLSKKEILELWLNSIPFGYKAEGIQTASKTFFGKTSDKLSPGEILALSVIPRSPAKYNPQINPENSVEASLKVGKRINFKITEDEVRKAVEDVSPYQWEFNAPHFVNFIKNSGKMPADGRKEFASSLDLVLNKNIESRLKSYIDNYHEFRLTNGAVIVLDNLTGEILGYVGSKDFYSKENSGEIDGVQILNQPGSALKPFLYGLAIDKFGFLPTTVLPDIPTKFGGEEIYIPENFNKRFNGPVRLRVALASSLNIPAVCTVVKIGVKNFALKLTDLGFDSLKDRIDRLGSGIAVGNAEISLYEISRAFATFPREGKKLELTFEKSVKREFKEGDRAFGPYASFIISDILSDSKSRTLGFGVTTLFDTPFQAMFKTGTSNQFNNLWALGATRDYTVGVWMGNFSGETVIGRTGSSIPALLCVEILKNMSKNKKPADFRIPDKVKKVQVCSLSGKKLTDNCPAGYYEYLPENADIQPCDFHSNVGGVLKTFLPPAYSLWLSDRKNFRILNEDGRIRKELEILTPNDNSVYYYDPSLPPDGQQVKIEAFCRNEKERLDVFINGSFYRSISYPFTFYFPLKRGKFNIRMSGTFDGENINIEVR
jgi:penicillin-binding protein 1C